MQRPRLRSKRVLALLGEGTFCPTLRRVQILHFRKSWNADGIVEPFDESGVKGKPQMSMHRLESVSPVRGRPYGLRLVWDDGRADTVDLSGVIYRYAAFASLRDSPGLFRSVKRIDRGYGIAWSRQMDYSAQSLRRLADEQRPMSGEELRSFEAQNKLTAAKTAAVLGVAVRTVKAYRRAKKLPVPVAIAVRAMRAEPGLLAAHYRPPAKKAA